MRQPYSTSAALRFTEMELGGPCMEVTNNIIISSGQDNIAAQNNPDRVGLIMMNISNASIWVNLLDPTNAGQGLFLSALGGSVSLNVRDDFTLPAREWHANSSGGALLLVIEIIRFNFTEYSDQ